MNAAVLARTEQFSAPADAEHVRRLRHDLAKTLADWGVTERAEDVLCSCSEMLTNALRYGQIKTLAAALTEQDGWLRLSVTDNNPFPPYPALADRDDENGRGIVLVTALADAWGFRASAHGKQVFAEFQLDGRTPPHSGNNGARQ